MLPSDLLPKISPNAAKVFLTLFSQIRFSADTKVLACRLPMTRLIQLTALSERACYRALHQLKTLHLIHTPPRKYHTPAVYLLWPTVPRPNTSPANLPPQANAPAQPRANAPFPGAPAPPPHAEFPIPASETQSVPPQSGLLTIGGPIAVTCPAGQVINTTRNRRGDPAQVSHRGIP